MNYLSSLDEAINQITLEFWISNLTSIQTFYERGYWDRLAELSFHDKLYKQYGYKFLYEIQGLSNQIHFGIANSISFRNAISTVIESPNGYNHRYTFMIESTIHCIYSYWNRNQ